MKRICVVLLALGLIMLGTYCQAAENTKSMEVSKVTMLLNADEETEVSLEEYYQEFRSSEMVEVVKSEIQVEGEDQSDDDGGDDGDDDDDGGDDGDDDDDDGDDGGGDE